MNNYRIKSATIEESDILKREKRARLSRINCIKNTTIEGSDFMLLTDEINCMLLKKVKTIQL